jgi:hypothetical protein
MPSAETEKLITIKLKKWLQETKRTKSEAGKAAAQKEKDAAREKIRKRRCGK